MPIYFQKPENALKRANEFIDVGKKDAALDVLYDVIKSKKHRSWQKIHDPILRKYLSLCVDLKRSVNAKEGLYQYKLICQQANIASLEEVVSFFLKLADQMADNARNQSIEQVTVEDLDMVQTPEGILLSSVSSEDAQDRSDRVLLTPWVKFLWEAYRNVLELLRNNNRVERLYHDTAQEAFRFCLKYTRRAEFRKLCTLIKNHLDQVLKYQGQPTAINLNNPDSLQLNLETRLFQLESAISMELWQEAFRAIEGIHYLMQLSKKPPKPHMMANYYDKVALVFFKADSYLFHAAALFKLFTLIKEQKKTVTADELQKIGSKVLLATLAIPIPPGQSAMEEYLNYSATTYEKEKRLATLLSLIHVPSRKGLIKELGAILRYVSHELKELYISLEEKFQPSQLCKKVHVALLPLQEVDDLKPYLPLIQKIATVRMLKQVSQIYETMTFGQLLAMVPYATEYSLERVIVEGVKNGDMQITLDHRQKSLTFGSALGVAMKEEVPEGPHLQAMPSEMLRSQLISLSQGLSSVLPMIMPDAIQRERVQQHEQIVQQYLRGERKEHAYILNRKQTIEQRKEKIENMRNEQERQEREKVNKQQEKIRVAEEQRLEVEREKREKERRVAEMKEIQKQQVWDRVALLRGTEIGKKAFKFLTPEEIDEMDPDDILQRQAEQLDREKRELQLKLKTQEKRIDHTARAMRLEEIPKLEESYEVHRVKDKELWYAEEQKRIDDAVVEHDIALKTKGRLDRMLGDKQAFLDTLLGNRHAEYETAVKEFEAKLLRARQERLEERRKQRVARRREQFIMERREQKRKEAEELRRREEELELEKQKKEAEERRKADEERRKQLDEMARKQRQKEQEAEEKLAKQRQQAAQAAAAAQSAAAGAKVGGQLAQESWRSGESDPDAGGMGSVSKYVPPSQRRAMPPAQPVSAEGDRKGEPSRDGPPSREGPPSKEAPANEGDSWRGGGGDSWRGGGGARDSRDDRAPRGFERGPRDDRAGQRDDRGGFDRASRDDRAGPERAPARDDRGGFERGPRDDRGGFERGPRDDRSGFERGPRDDRGGFERGARDDRGGVERGPSRDDRAGWGSSADRRERPPIGDKFSDRRSDRSWGGGDRSGGQRQDDRYGGDKRDDRTGEGGGGMRREERGTGFSGSRGWGGGGGSSGGGGGSWRDASGPKPEGRSWQASRVRSDRDRDDADKDRDRDQPRPAGDGNDADGWTVVR